MLNERKSLNETFTIDVFTLGSHNSASHHSNLKNYVRYLKVFKFSLIWVLSHFSILNTLKTVYGIVRCYYFPLQEKNDVEHIECVEQKIAQN